jgi:hypothetical protein
MAARAYIGSIKVTINPRTISTIAIASSPIVILLFSWALACRRWY